MNSQTNICVVGLGYVGLPLAIELSKHYSVVAYDTNEVRVGELMRGYDRTGEVGSKGDFEHSMKITNSIIDASDCNVFIVTVPTPVLETNLPDLGPLKGATIDVAGILSPGDLVIYESTVYPGVTENICAPLLAEYSGLTHLVDFNVGYSPERINPGDALNKLTTITKLVSGDCAESKERTEGIYSRIISAGIHACDSISVAECCKCFENIQRDVNIALANTLSVICDRAGISTMDVINAGKTKWNFLPFEPGLVGGHCIGIDPYYMLHYAREKGLQVPLIQVARDVNEGVITRLVSKVEEEFPSQKLKILVCGYTFKEDCPDVRNSKVADLVSLLKVRGHEVEIYDPIADCDHVTKEIHNISRGFDLLIFAVKHASFRSEYKSLIELAAPEKKVFDLKHAIPREFSDWSL